ncbi:hypothetical protein FA15DRAFT_755845 [Coprinopsis marcescibilis]|uniref:Fungal-type protein kinase domain-containing protein n=1 Tax=Coprinopsis marcescibilis TaxID=230819 RepID=A0A5C3KYE0_COPMA|nr:hypothetical protein FA15DRAFT_755845 [Coprinopsis marcescibilis]
MVKLTRPTAKISTLFGDPTEDELHVVVFAPRTVTPYVDQGSELPEFTQYKNTVGTKGHVPSVGATSSGYREVQMDQGQTIYDGLKAPYGPLTVAPPITIFHRIFQQFLKLVDDDSTQVTTADLVRMENFTYMLSTLHTTEATFNATCWLHLTGILGREVTQEEDTDRICADGCYFVRIGEARVPIVIYEGKTMLGNEDQRLYDLTRVFVALRKCVNELEDYHRSLDNVPPFVEGKPHPWYFPYTNSYTTKAGVVVYFRYICALEQDPQCVTYLAELDGSEGSQGSKGSEGSRESKRSKKLVVVKFVT